MIKRISNYISGSIEELRKVAWPTRNQAVRSTLLVLSISIVLLIFIGILDFAFQNGYDYLSQFLTGN